MQDDLASCVLGFGSRRDDLPHNTSLHATGEIQGIARGV